MNKYKYYSRTSKNKEAMGVVEAKSKEFAAIKASNMKGLPINVFTMLFEMEKMP